MLVIKLWLNYFVSFGYLLNLEMSSWGELMLILGEGWDIT